jgi:hypothetical protein
MQSCELPGLPFLFFRVPGRVKNEVVAVQVVRLSPDGTRHDMGKPRRHDITGDAIRDGPALAHAGGRVLLDIAQCVPNRPLEHASDPFIAGHAVEQGHSFGRVEGEVVPDPPILLLPGRKLPARPRVVQPRECCHVREIVVADEALDGTHRVCQVLGA